jgi:hypothetical protein
MEKGVDHGTGNFWIRVVSGHIAMRFCYHFQRIVSRAILTSVRIVCCVVEALADFLFEENIGTFCRQALTNRPIGY